MSLSTPAYSSNPGIWQSLGKVSTAAVTTVPVMASSFSYPSADINVYIASSNANDTLAGTGAQKITIVYFKANGTGPLSEIASLQGTTGFFSANTMAFIQSVEVSQVGSGGANAGNILLSNLSPIATVASVLAGDNQTFYAQHFVGLGKTCYITYLSFGSTATAVGQGGVFNLKKQKIPLSSNPVLTAGIETLVGTTSTTPITFKTPIVVVGPALIYLNITPNSSTANTFNASLGGYEL